MLLLIGASVIIGFGFNLSEGNTIVAIYLHGINIGLGVIMNDFLGRATIRKSPDEGAIIAASFVFTAVLLAIATRGRLGMTRGGQALDLVSAESTSPHR